MGVSVPRSVADYPRHKLDFGLRCRTCGRTSVYDPRDVLIWAMSAKWSVALPLDVSRFRCRCRSRDVEAIAVPACLRPTPLPPRPPLLEPIYVKPHR